MVIGKPTVKKLIYLLLINKLISISLEFLRVLVAKIRIRYY